MSASFISGAKPPDGSGVKLWDVIAPNPEIPRLSLTFLGPTLLGVQCHWLGAGDGGPRSVGCLREWGDCLRCGSKRRLWLGFAAVWDHLVNKRAIVRMGRTTALAVCRFGVPHFGMQGIRLELFRGGKSKTAECAVERSQHAPLDPLVTPHDIRPTLRVVLELPQLPDLEYTTRELCESEEPS